MTEPVQGWPHPSVSSSPLSSMWVLQVSFPNRDFVYKVLISSVLAMGLTTLRRLFEKIFRRFGRKMARDGTRRHNSGRSGDGWWKQQQRSIDLKLFDNSARTVNTIHTSLRMQRDKHLIKRNTRRITYLVT